VNRIGPALCCAALLALTACASKSDQGVRGLLGVNTSGLNAGGTAAGYVDIDKVIAAHPLNAELQSLQDQITELNASTVTGPKPVTPVQVQAQADLQRQLADAEAAYTKDLADKQAAFRDEEVRADSAITAKALGIPNAGPGGIMSGMQADFARQLAAMQTDARATLAAYRTSLYAQDADHLSHVRLLISSDVEAKIRSEESQLSSAETAYQIQIARQDQDSRLNLTAKLDNLSLSPADRQNYSAQLQALENSEATLAATKKSADAATLAAFEKSVQKQAELRFNAERAATEKDTNAKLAARQTDLESAIRDNAQKLGGQFQSQLNAANAKLGNNPQVQAQLTDEHTKILTRYQADATAALDSYQSTRKALVAKYSDVAHMQFQDNVALAMQAQSLAQAHQQLYDGMVRQIQTLVADVARRDGIGVVFSSVAGAGSAVDLTDQVAKAAAALPSATPAPIPGG
jgi:hypothetical protein